MHQTQWSAERPLSGNVAEIHMLKLDHAVSDRQLLAAALVLALGVQNREDPLGAGHGGLDLTVELRQLVDRAAELP